MSQLTPKKIVQELDKHIIGQHQAKKAVAIALRNRWRRMQLDEELRSEISPKNILMIGPTGVGKTEIARRLAKLADAPFIKVEATKFTEVGYVGRDVESIIRDFADIAMKMYREKAQESVKKRAEELAEERILDALLHPTRKDREEAEDNDDERDLATTTADSSARALLRKRFKEGTLNEKEIDIDVSASSVGVEIMAPPGMEEMTSQLQNLFSSLSSSKKKTKRMKIKDAYKQICDEEASKLVNEEEIKTQAIQAIEENGIVFIDEIDKVCRRSEQSSGGDVSREGVQRDLLPLIEGCAVSTKHGIVRTDHILFIASGAFHLAKPSDLIPELQGRLPIRVELQALTPQDFERILTEPSASLTQQYQALLKTEGVNISFSKESITKLAEIAWQVNERTENIGARRLHTVLEKLLEDLSFEADGLTQSISDTLIEITAQYVIDHLETLSKNEDLSRYIL